MMAGAAPLGANDGSKTIVRPGGNREAGSAREYSPRAP